LLFSALAATGGVDDKTAEKPLASDQAEVAEALSPSQEARVKINQIRNNDFFYQSYGKNDPFRTLVHGEFEQHTASELVDLGSARLVGVMWGDQDQFALVEDGEGFGYVLRVGDQVQNGRVVSIRKNALTARITLYGITSSVILKLEKTEG
jgi:Tfp pilus assembly protein PilP